MRDRNTAQNLKNQNRQNMTSFLALHTALETARATDTDNKFTSAASGIKILAAQTAKAV